VAIKFLLPAMMAHADIVARFVREARAAVRIQSEHVARVIDVGELEGGAPFMVMEYLEGTDLADALASTARPSAVEALEYVLQACEAVAEAHSLGIVHRDLKPANLFVTRRADGSSLVKVLDFGISKSLDGSADQQLTKTQAFVGSVMYSSPEQLLSSRSVDARTDIWALGVILYEACSGERPFTGDTVMECAARIMQVPPRALGELRPDLPAALCAAIMTCLEKDVARRYANVGDLSRALGPHAPRASSSVERISRLMPALATAATELSDAAPVTAPAPVLATPPAAAPSASTQAAWDQRSIVVPQHSRRWLLVIPVALLVGAGLAVALHQPAHVDNGSPQVPADVPSAIPSGAPTLSPLASDTGAPSVSAVPSASASASASAPPRVPLARPQPKASAAPVASAVASAPPPESSTPRSKLDIKIR